VLGLLFCAGCIAWGSALLRIVGLTLPRVERSVIGPVVGVATGTWLLLQISSFFHALSVAALIVTLGIFAIAVVVARRRPQLGPGKIPLWFLVCAAVLVAALVALNLYAVLAPSRDGLMAFEHVWADAPFHTSIATAFAYRDVYPPKYTIALGQPLNYPFLVDFLTGTLLRYGLGLRGSFIAVNVFIQTAFFLGLALIVYRLSSSARAAILAVVVFFLLGNLGWLAVARDVSHAGGFLSWIRKVPWSYTGETAGVSGKERLGTGLYLGNPVFMHLLPRRSAAFGMAVGASAFLLLDDLVANAAMSTAIVTGLAAGVLPRVHAHTAIDFAIVAAVWFAVEAFRRRSDRDARGRLIRVVAVAGFIAVIVAAKDVAAMQTQTGHFFAFWPGWTGEPRSAFTGPFRLGRLPGALATTAWFWILNAGLLLLLVPFAWVEASDRLKRWYAPFVVVWLLGFLVRTQPWEWDNNNHFVWWQAATIVFVSPMLASWLWARTSAVRSLAVASVIALTLGGVLSFVYGAEHRLHLWSAGDVKFAKDVRLATPRDAVILTGNGHEEPVVYLSGRQAVMGYAGWFSSHGLDEPRYEHAVNTMLAGDVDRMRRLGVGYVVLGPWEDGQAADQHFKIGTAFADRKLFDLVLQETFDGRTWQLLKLR